MINNERLSAIFFRTLANLFIVFFICRSIFMCWPFDQKSNPRNFLPVFSVLSSMFALDADLALFSPNPPSVIDQVKFVVYFDDGTFGEWKFPGDRLLPWDSNGSYQQYIRNALFWTGKRALIRLYKYEARYIARQMVTPTRRPVRIYFYHATVITPPPEVGIGKPLVRANDFHLFYSYLVKPGELE